MRKLAIGAFAFAAAIFVSNYILPRSSVLYAALACALIGAAVLGVKLKSLRSVVIGAFCASLGFALFSLHADLTTEKAHALSGQTALFCFRLVGQPEQYPTYTSVDAQLDMPGLPKLNTILYDSEGRLDAFSAGDRIRGSFRLSAADIRYGVQTDRYTSKDVYLTANAKDQPELTGKKYRLDSAMALAADAISRRIESLFPQDAAPFMQALMIGDKRALYADDALYVALSRAGLMHIVAVSGMHVSYLVGFLQLLLGKSRRNSIFCMILVWLFVCMSGMSPSAVRAAFMQTMLLLAPLFGREDDPLTSLAAALAFLMLLNPFSATSVSLQLSFAAMLGIVLFSEKIMKAMLPSDLEGRLAVILKCLISAIASSISVLIFSLPLTALYFGYVTVLSPLSNLLCLFMVPYCFIGGYLSCLLSFVPYVGEAAAFLTSWLVRYLVFISRKLSALPFSAIYLPSGWMLFWVGFVLLSIAGIVMICRKKLGRIVISLSAAVISLFIIHAGLHLYYSAAKGTVTAIDVGQGQCICAISGKSAVLVDCGSSSYAEYNAGDRAAAYLKSCGVERLDAVVFTHLHADHANGLVRLTNLIPVEKIILPAKISDSDNQFMELLRCAAQHRIPIEWVTDDRLEFFDSLVLTLFSPEGEGDENERCMPVILSIGDFDVITTGDAPAKSERALAEKAELSGIDLLIVGHHGSKSSSCEEYLAEIGGGKAIISVGNNSYGLPAPETLERLDAFGYTVFRTDLDGNVELRING